MKQSWPNDAGAADNPTFLPLDDARCHARTPIGAIAIDRCPNGHWRVVFEGFSRSSNPSLAAAISEAVGVPRSEDWLVQLIAELESLTPNEHVTATLVNDLERRPRTPKIRCLVIDDRGQAPD